MKKQCINLFACIALLLVTISACTKIADDVHWDLDFKLNLIETELDPGDIFTDTLLQANGNHLKLVLDYNLSSGLVDSLIKIDDTLSYNVFTLPFTSFILKPGDTIIKSNFKSVLNLNDIDLRQVNASKIRILLSISNQIKERMLVTYRIPKAIKNGQSFTMQAEVNSAIASGSTAQILELNLDGYTIDFTGPTQQDKNSLEVNVICIVHPLAQNVEISSADSVKVLSKVRDFDINWALGYFGSSTYQSADSSSLNVFDVFSSGMFDLQNVKASINFVNYLGIDVSLNTNYLKSFNAKTGTSIDLQSQFIGTQINIARARKSSFDIASLIPSVKQIDLSTSNVEKLIENMPSRLDYSMDFQTNPMGNLSMGNDFAFGGKGLDANIHLEIPLTISANQLVIEDVINYSFDQKSAIQRCALYVSGDNSYNYNFEFQMFILNEQLQVVDSIYALRPIIYKGVINHNLDVELSQSQLQHLRSNKKLRIYTKISSLIGLTDEIFASDRLKLKLTVGGRYAQ